MNMKSRVTYCCLLWYRHKNGLPTGFLQILRHHHSSAVVQGDDTPRVCFLLSEQYAKYTVKNSHMQNSCACHILHRNEDKIAIKREQSLPSCHGQVSKRGHISENFNKTIGSRNNWHLQPLLSVTEKQKHACNFHTGCVQNSKQSYQAATSEFHRNPIDELQKYIALPLIPDSHSVFSPGEEEIKAAEKLFIDPSGTDIRRAAKATHEDFWPEPKSPEVLFLGRSNVGKSSLLKALLKDSSQVQKLAKTSRTPGRTRSLQFFDVNNRFMLVDAPGYGFNMPQNYHISVESYLQNRKTLCRTLVLIDGEVGINSTDHIGLNMVEEYKIPYVLVITKIDKVKVSKLVRSLVSVMKYRDEHTLCCLPQPFLVSSHTGAGLQLLKTFIGYLTGCVEMKSK